MTGRLTQGAQTRRSDSTRRTIARAHPVTAAVDQGALAGCVGDDLLAGIGRRRRPPVGDEVEQGLVDVVADGADDRGACSGDGADHRLVGEGQQLLERPAAAGDDDDVDPGLRIELGAGPRRPR